jgi:hypothetical protein
MPMTEARWRGHLGHLRTLLGGLMRGSGRGLPLVRSTGGPNDPAGAAWDAPADARARLAGRLAAAGVRLRAENDRLQAERAYGVVDFGAQERQAGQERAHRAALRGAAGASGGATSATPAA